jgi:hypothetical protein
LAVAEQHGFDETLAARVRAGDTASLDERHRLAVALADALMTQPADLDDATVAALREAFSDDQLIELCVDTMKWNYQKVPVTLGTDPEVRPGEIVPLVFDERGHWVRPR